MAPSESPESLAELLADLDAAEPAERSEILGTMQRTILEDPALLGDRPATGADTLTECLDSDDPGVRAGAVNLLPGFLNDDSVTFSEDEDAIAGRILTMIDDENRHVRQTVLSPAVTNSLVGDALDDGGTNSKPLPWLSERLLDRLHDPVPIVRKRAAYYIESHAVTIIEAHPDTEAAIAALVAAFDDDLDALAPNRDATTPRYAAVRALKMFADHDEQRVAAQTDAIGGLLTDDTRNVRSVATRLLLSVYEEDLITMEALEPHVRRAVDAGTFPLWSDTRSFLVEFARTYPDAVDPVYEHFWGEITAERTDYSHRFSENRSVDGLVTLLRETNPTTHPPAETLVEAADEVDFSETDPLVVLAVDHPEFVAEQLRTGYQKVVDGELRGRNRFNRELAAAVAEENEAAVDGVPAVLGQDLQNRYLLRGMYDLAAVCPGRVAEAFPESLRTGHWGVPVSNKLPKLIERTAGEWQGIPEEMVEDLVGTVEYERNDTTWRRSNALCALVALYEHGHDAVPDRVDPFVELYHEGAFDEDREDPVDPLETNAAVLGGWGQDEDET